MAMLPFTPPGAGQTLSIRPSTYWAPRRLFARVLAGEATPEDVGEHVVQVLSYLPRRQWVMAERVSDGAKLRVRPVMFLQQYAEVKL